MKETTDNGNHSLIQLGGATLRRPAPGAFTLRALSFALAGCLGAHAQQAATALATVTNGSVAGVEVTAGGSGYNAPPAVTFVGGGGNGASATAQVSNGAVSAITVQSPGSGYLGVPIVAINPPPVAQVGATLGISMIPMLTIRGQAWTVQQVEYASDVGGTNEWVTLTNFVSSGGPAVVFDTSAPVERNRFYRVETLGAPGPDPARWAWINAGTFTMGSPMDEFDRSSNESPQTQVTISRGFWIGRFELTEGEYSAVTGTNFSTFTSDTNEPVEQVSWIDASNYCAVLTLQEQAAGRVPAGYAYRLPTEAEWEYATRAGTTNRFFFGDDPSYTLLLNYAWVLTNSVGTTHDVGGKLPNPWGLYDTSGNVWEWCADWYGPYPGAAVTDPTGPASGTSRVMRGGSWRYMGGDARSATRDFNPSDFASYGVGFRVVLSPAPL